MAAEFPSWAEQQEIARALDDRLWERVAQQICRELFKEVRLPQTDEERQDFKSRLSRVREQSMLWRLEPHPKQWWFFSAQNLLRLFLGSNQSGKTTAIIAEFLTNLLGYRPWLLGKAEDDVDRFGRRYGDLSVLSPLSLRRGGEFYPIQALLGAKDFVNSVTEILVPKISQMIPLDLLKESYDKVQGKTIHKIHLWNGSSWKFFSYEAEDDKVEGPTWDLVGFDEPPTRGHYVAVRRGCMAKSAPVLFSMTLLKEPWIHEELFSRSIEVVDDVSFARSQRIEEAEEGRASTIFSVLVDLDENPFLTPQQKAEFIATLRPDEIEVRVHGRPRHLMGRIYSRFDKAKHVREVVIERDWPVGMVMDPHSRRPFAIAWYAVNPRDEMIFFREWPNAETPGWPTGAYGPLLYHQVQEWPWGVREYLEELARVEADFVEQVWWRDMDPNYGRTKSASTGRTLQQDFDRDYVVGHLSEADEDVLLMEESVGRVVKGVRFRCDVDNDIERGHLSVKERLIGGSGDPLLYVTPNCVNILHGFEHYTWNEYKSHDADSRASREQPREKYKDFMDVVRYACVRDPRWFDMTAEVAAEDARWLAGASRGGLGS